MVAEILLREFKALGYEGLEIAEIFIDFADTQATPKMTDGVIGLAAMKPISVRRSYGKAAEPVLNWPGFSGDQNS